jgi:hypothetical protein
MKTSDMKANISGYYYAKDSSGSYNEKRILPRILFKDGTFWRQGQVYSTIDNKYYLEKCIVCQDDSYTCCLSKAICMLKDYEENGKVGTHYLNSNPAIGNWGKYRIEEERITIQYFENFHGDYYLTEEEGELIDTNSFRINKEYSYRTGKASDINELYEFYPIDVENLIKFKPGKFPEN